MGGRGGRGAEESLRGDWRGWSPLKEVEVLQYEDMGEAGYASCAEYFFFI